MERLRHEKARDEIIRAHDEAYFKPDAAWLTVRPGEERDHPDLLSTPAFIRAIREKYFAATGVQVTRFCREHFVPCGDPQAFEYVVRSIHNAEIMKSREAKLAALEADGPLRELASHRH